jgi:orotidine-5'-phosphate decarboxylase
MKGDQQMNFSNLLRSVQRTKNSLLCVGLDTDPAKIPAHLASVKNPIAEFNKRIIAATHNLVCAYKINLAFYESLGDEGWRVMRETLEHIPPDVITIADGKRGDIGNSSERYAASLLNELPFHASTVSPYMGFDSVEPFLRHPEKGAFILAVTSNPGAKDFQYLRVRGLPLYEHVIRRVKKWNTLSNCGLVVGATRPGELKRVRTIVPAMPLLLPGIGAQGGSVQQAVRWGCDKQGEMAIINASRSVLYASSDETFYEAARSAAIALRDEINHYREKYF